MYGQSGQPREGSAVELDAAWAETQPRLEHAFAVVAGSQPPQQRIGFEPRAAASSAGRVRAVLRQQHPDVHLVRLGLEPGEEPLDAVPGPRPGALPALPLGLAFQHPSPVRLAQVTPRYLERDAALFRVFHELVLTLAKARALPRLDRARAKRLRSIGNDEPVVDADHAAEAAAGLARAKRGVGREEAGRRVAVADIAIRAVQ